MKKILLLLLALDAGFGLIPTGRLGAQTFTNLHSFSGGTNGSRPFTGVVISGNTLYGTTLYNNFNDGTVFAVNTDGSGFTNLHEFDGFAANPGGNLLLVGNTLFGTTSDGGNAGGGNLFSLNVANTNYSNLHTFNGGLNDGLGPLAALILSGNTFYGTTKNGGSGGGTVFSISTSGTGISLLHRFTAGGSGSDGQSPEAPLILSGNTLYGTTYQGASAFGTVFAVNTDGKGFRVVHTFTGGTNGANSQGGLVLSGNALYGTTRSGGSSGVGMVFKVNTDGTGFADLHDFKGPFTDGYQPEAGLLLANGTLYGTTIQGGSGNDGTVFQIHPDGTDFAILYSFTALQGGTNSDGTGPQSSLILSGNTLYGTAAVGGPSGNNGTVFALTLPPAATTIDPSNHFAYGANIGWLDSRGDTNNGLVVGEYVCSGFLYGANVGWINLGNGTPTNGIYYQNLSSNDFGVNQDGLGNLRGFAYGANIGWLNFETNGSPTVDLQTGILSGYVWSANCGWISLSNAFAYVQTDKILPGADANGDGIPDAWALQHFGTINIDPNADPDHDSMSNLQEYLAGTDPNDGNDNLRITSIARGISTAISTTLQWTAKPTRFYSVQLRPDLAASSSWASFYTSALGADNVLFFDGHTNDFFRVGAFRPLMQ